MRAAVLLLSVCACAEPVVEIENPADGSTIPIGKAELEVLVHDSSADDVTLEIDGVPADVDYMVFNRPVTCDGCVGKLVRWKSIDTTAGIHELTVHATAAGAELGTATISAEFSNAPAIRRIAPQTYQDIGGIGQLDVRYGITARDPVAAQIVFGTQVGALDTASCRTECEVAATLDTASPFPGDHELAIRAAVGDGSETVVNETLSLQDVVRVSGIEMFELPLELSHIDVEVWLFDVTAQRMIGCVGKAAFPVEAPHVYYTTAGDLQNVGGTSSLFRAIELLPPDHTFHFEVWDNDDSHSCPSVPDPSIPDFTADDLMGVSAAHTFAEWQAAGTQTFGKVEKLDLGLGRPFAR